MRNPKSSRLDCSLRLLVVASMAASIAFCAQSAVASASSTQTQPAAEYRIGQYLYRPTTSPDTERPYVRMLVSPFAQPNIHTPIIKRTIDALKDLYGDNNFEVRLFSGDPQNFDDIDLILCSAGTYLRVAGNGARDIATVVSNFMPDPNHAEGSLFVTLKNRSDINTFADMRNKRIVTTGYQAFAGYFVAMAEIARRGENPDTFFSDHLTVGYDMSRTLELLRSNAADIAIVRTCFLEELKAQGTDVSDIKPLALRNETDLAPDQHLGKCMTSTDLYPNWSVLVTPRMSSELARATTLALLSMPADKAGLRWSVASDFSSTDAMYKSIRRGPYEYLRTWTWSRFWHENWQWIVMALLGIFGLIAHSLRASRLVQLRTAELRHAIEEQKRLEQLERSASNRMQALQRAGIVGQMSSIIAHELRQPLTTIVSYAHGIERLSDRPENLNKDLVSHGVGLIRAQAEAAEAIVRKVRDYAKGKSTPHKALDMSALVSRVVDTVNASRISSTVIVFEPTSRNLYVWGDELELEITIQNLLKNAVEAATQSPAPAVSVKAYSRPASENQEQNLPAVVIEVSNTGPVMSETDMQELTDVLSSSKIEGLGLGLSIVRMMIERHGGTLRFTPNPQGGLTAAIVLAQHRDNLND